VSAMEGRFSRITKFERASSEIRPSRSLIVLKFLCITARSSVVNVELFVMLSSNLAKMASGVMAPTAVQASIWISGFLFLFSKHGFVMWDGKRMTDLISAELRASNQLIDDRLCGPLVLEPCLKTRLFTLCFGKTYGLLRSPVSLRIQLRR
jgi:hypothetical protein